MFGLLRRGSSNSTMASKGSKKTDKDAGAQGEAENQGRESSRGRGKHRGGERSGSGSSGSGVDRRSERNSKAHSPVTSMYSAGSLKGSSNKIPRGRSGSEYSAGILSPAFSDSDDALSASEVSSSESASSESESSRSSSESSVFSESSSEDSENGTLGRRRRSMSSTNSAAKKKNKATPDLAADISKTIREHARTGEDVMNLIKERFQSTDKNGNGSIDAEEFRLLLKSILGGREVAQEESLKLLKQFKMDVNGDGRVTYDEFVSFVSLDREALTTAADILGTELIASAQKEGKGSIGQLAGRLFARFAVSKNKKQALGLKEFQVLAGQFERVGARTMTNGELEFLMSRIDRQGKGEIDLPDLQLFMEEAAAAAKQARVDAQSKGSKHAQDKKAAERNADLDFAVVDLRLALRRKQGEEEELLSQGFTRVNVNLNDRGRGSTIYLFVKRANAVSFGGDSAAFKRARITDLALSKSKHDVALLTLGYQCVMPYQVNHGAWMVTKQYLWFRRNQDDKFPILDVSITSGRRKDLASKLWTPPYRGYKRLDGDLNRGNSGSQVFLWYYKHDFVNEIDKADPHAEFIQVIRNKLRDLSMSGSIDEGGDSSELDLDKLWEKFDRQGRGYLSRARLAAMLSQAGFVLKRKDSDKIMEILDVNHDNRIDRDEFMDFMSFNPAEVASLVKRVREELAKRNIKTKSQIRAWFSRESQPAEEGDDEDGDDDHHHPKGKRGGKRRPAVKKTAKQLYKLLKSIGIRLRTEECRSVMGHFDSNGDGLVDVDEFTDFLLSRKVAEEQVRSRHFATVEAAANKLRLLARAEETPKAAADRVFGGSDEPRLSRDRLDQFLREEMSLKLSPGELVTLFQRVGASRDKFAEFVTSSTYLDAVMNMLVEAAVDNTKHADGRRLSAGESAASLFRRFDTDGDGRLSKQEFAAGLATLRLDGKHPIQLGDSELDKVIARLDRDGDGEVDVREFVDLVESAQRIREAVRNAGDLLDRGEMELGDPKVKYTLAALRKLYVENGRKAEVIFSKLCENPRAEYIVMADMRGGLERVGIVPQEVKLSNDQLDTVFRRLDYQDRGRVTLSAWKMFLQKDSRGERASSPKSASSPLSEQGGTREQRRVEREFCSKIRKAIGPVAQDLEDECHEMDNQGTGAVSNQDFADLLGEYLPRSAMTRLHRRFASEQVKRSVDYESFFEWVDALVQGKQDASDDNDDDDDVDAREADSLADLSDENSRGRGRKRLAKSQSGLGAFGRKISKEARTANKLKSLLSDHAEDIHGVTRDELNDVADSLQIDPISKENWNRTFGKKSRVSSSRIIKAVFHKLAGSSSSGSSTRSGSSCSSSGSRRLRRSQKSPKASPLSPGHLASALEYVGGKLRAAQDDQGFSWERGVRLFDKDGSGTIRLRDLAKLLKSSAGCELSSDKLRALAEHTNSLRSDGSRVNYEHFFARILPMEFLNAGHNVPFERVAAKVASAIQRVALASGGALENEAVLEQLDVNGDGRVSTSELAKTLPKLLGGAELSPDEFATLVERFDLKGDGFLDLDELRRLLFPKTIRADTEDIISRVRHEMRVQSRRGLSLVEPFKSADSQNEGLLSRRAFRQIFEQSVRPESRVYFGSPEIRKIMDRFERQGKVDYVSFCNTVAPSEIEMHALEAKLRDRVRALFASTAKKSSHKLKRAFALFDVRGTGQVSRVEFRQACERLGLALADDELEIMFRRFDTTQSGSVDYFEFARMVSQDGSEIAALEAQIGRQLDMMQHEHDDPIQYFEKAEGRQSGFVGLLPRHEFQRVCKHDLRLGLSESELSALADLYADSTAVDMVKYRDFVLSILGSVGASYRMRGPSFGAHLPGISAEHDKVWNPLVMQTWLRENATAKQRETFNQLQESMAAAGKRDRKTVNLQRKIEETPPVAVQRSSGFWDCPVCFYKQTRPGRFSCEMCDSPAPSSAGQWPHIKPLLDSAYGRVGKDFHALVSRANDGSDENTHHQSSTSSPRAPKWHFNTSVLAENDTSPDTGRRRGSSKKRSSKKPSSSRRATRGSSSSSTSSRSPRGPHSPRAVSPRGSVSPRSSRFY